uniref:Uncharacterized protein n=1 Tax=Glossina brevipalpis TaxID=37001 RepID=A0A1A9W1J5_9MUSC
MYHSNNSSPLFKVTARDRREHNRFVLNSKDSYHFSKANENLDIISSVEKRCTSFKAIRYIYPFKTADVCQLRPPTNNLPGAGSEATEPLTLLLGVWPLIAIINFGVLGAVLWSVRAFFTRDDVRFPSKRMRCECAELRQHPLYKIRPTKYDVPDGLVKAYLGEAEESTE